MGKGRKKELAEGTKRITVQLEPEQLVKIGHLAQVHGLKISQVLRKAIEAYTL